jgi:hypothetical protein
MFKATRELIKLRQPYTNSIGLVSVRRVSGGEPRRCYDNSCRYIENNKESKIVSGWYVNKWDKASNTCLIVSHYWNIDSNGVFIDSTPAPLELLDGEYVIDSDIGLFANENGDLLLSELCSSIIINGSNITGVDFREQGKVYRKFNDFSTKSLFAELNESSN